ncbi:ATP-dependent nuclease [Microbacterium sp. NPDC088619]|uniref:ATP-dependent nuclease n=1 Tax=Microbacterium sp. NPDC088619 TaxID=3364196 RepID=UPI003803B5FC
MTDTFDQLANFVPNNVAEPLIRSVRFPRFKNLSDHLTLTFDFPITALIGPNGTNKSSILRAIQACPDQYNIGDHWFDTPLDPIGRNDEGKADPHRYIHTYRTPSGRVAEVLKVRVDRKDRGPDYFETSAPRRRDRMAAMPGLTSDKDSGVYTKTRWRPIQKEVVYLDFRQELPAYDILMHFAFVGQNADIDSKKARIRRSGGHVAAALENLESSHSWHRRERILEAAEELSDKELRALNLILGREYNSVRLLKHEYFGVAGYTASLATKKMEYSEAYAGSGEYAALMIVRRIARANPRSLIVLDEPETSLHPGAQRELMRFIARECLEKKHQVIMATHSPAMVAELPDCARKLLDTHPSTGKVEVVSNSASVSESFSRVGSDLSGRSIVVEDDLAREFLLRAARAEGTDFLNGLSITIVPGGADTILQRLIPVEAQMNSLVVVILDGDKRPTDATSEASILSDEQLQGVLDQINIPTSVLIRDGGNGAQDTQLSSARRRTLSWVNERLDYLPTRLNPECLLLEMLGESITDPELGKQEWVARASVEFDLLPSEAPNAADILATQRAALARVATDHELFLELRGELRRLAAH